MSDQRPHGGSLPTDFQVGDWLVVPRGNRMVGPDGPERLEPKVMQVLVCLAETPGRTVPKDAFMDRVWEGTVVSDDVLARCISELRKVFDDNPRRPHYIETVRKSGYRLIAPVSAPQEREAPDAFEEVEQQPERNGQHAPFDERVPEVLATARPPFPARADLEDGEVVVVEPAVVDREPEVGVERALPVPAPQVPSSTDRPHAWSPRHRAALQWGLGLAVVACIGLLLGFFLLGEEEPAQWKAVPFTSFPGREAEPALSPNGSRLAFTWGGPDGSNVDVYVKQEGAETPLRLTDHPAREQSPTWSPDGRRVAFVRVADTGEREVVIVPAIGGSEQSVARFENQEVEALDWSPGGETLAISAQAAPGEPFAVFLLAVETRQMRQLTEPPASYRGDLDPSFSPNGERLAFVRSAGAGAEDLFVVPVRGGEPERLTHVEREIAGIDWMPGGERIVFASSRPEGSGLWQVAAAGGTPEWVVPAAEGEIIREPSVARRGRRLAYEQRSADANIWAIQVGRFRGEPILHSTRWESNPQFSPGGQRIAFASARSGSPEIWLSDADGSNPIQLTEFAGGAVSMPRWSPDGGRIAFDARTEAGADIYVIDANGGQPRRLTEDPADDLAPSWSQDSTTVYFTSNRSGAWEIWQIRAEGGRPSQLTYRGGYNAFESPDGRYLYYAKKGEPGLWRYSLLGDEDETLVLGALEPFDWGNWALTDNGIYFIRREAMGPTIRFYSFVSGWSSPVATLDEVPEQPSLAVSPDGRTLLYTHVDRNESDILLIEDFR